MLQGVEGRQASASPAARVEETFASLQQGKAGAGFSAGAPGTQAATGLDFCRCVSHGDKDLVFQQAAASYINYNSKHGETKRFSRDSRNPWRGGAAKAGRGLREEDGGEMRD